MKVKFGNGSETGVKNYTMGKVGGRETKITHRNPSTGEFWCEDIPDEVKYIDGKEVVLTYGRWVPGDKIEFVE